MWRRSNDHKLVNENFHKFLASIARVYPPTDHDEMQARPSSFHTLPKLIWCSSWGCNLGQSLSNHELHVFYWRKIQRASRPGKQFNLVIEEPLDNACHVWSRIMLLKYGWGHALKVKKDHGVSRLKSDHRGVADRCVTRQ
ncbi:uncharacterized protein TNCV_4772461 [Trichonephila clavipes]|nr:uncharacterized protein TNCV_4772461 [Trichonephila clavipes]